MKHKGTKSLSTPRLLLRKFDSNDANSMYKNWVCDSDVSKYLTWQPHNSIDETKNLLDIWCKEYSNESNYNWVVVLKETNQPIGSVSVVKIDQTDNIDQCEFGYCFSKQYWNKGIATESMQIVFDYLFNEIGFDIIIGCYDNHNISSKKVMDKLNMRFIGETADNRKNNKGEIVPFSQHSITKEEFNSVSIRQSYQYEVDLVGDIYDGIVTHLENTTNFCGWKHGIYPTLEVAQKAFAKQELFVAIQSGKVIGTCVLNNEQAVQYFEIDWEIKDDKPLVVHTVAINPKNLRQRIAHKLLEFAKVYAKEQKFLTIRLDASEPNIPARKIYEDVGFIKRGEMDLQTNRGGINNWFGYEFII